MNFFYRLCALSLLLPAALPAVEVDPDLPQPFDPNSVTPVVQNSPFTRMVNLSDNLVLTGIANISQKPVATIFNKETKQSFVVSSVPNFQGWVLNDVTQTPDISRSQVKVTIGGEVVSVRYDAAAMAQANTKADKKANREERREGDGRFNRPNRGPSEEDRKRYEALSDNGKEKVRNLMREKFSDEKFRNAPEEERRNIIRREVENIEKRDRRGGN